MSDYRLEACSVCGGVRREIRSAITRQREREGIDRLEWYGDTPIYVVDFCPSCLRAWEESIAAAASSPEATEGAPAGWASIYRDERSGIAQLRQIATAIIEDNKSSLTADDAVCVMTAAELLSEGAPAVTREGPLYEGACHDCGRRYGDRFGFPDLLIADWAWAQITPAPHPEGGLLCPSCIVRRCEAIGLEAVPATFASGPLVSITYEAFRALSTTAPVPVGEQALRSLRERLMVALARYELDEPHWIDGPLSPDECDHLTAEKLAEWLEQEHDGDCTGEAHTCARCLAEHWRHKADWIARAVSVERGEEVPNGKTT